MKAYLVLWQIEVEANSELEAARLAKEIQTDVESIANVFQVYDNSHGDAGIISAGFNSIDLDEVQ
jgi:hypothetical protein